MRNISMQNNEYQIYENMATVETKMRWALDNPGMYTVEELQQIQEEYAAACRPAQHAQAAGERREEHTQFLVGYPTS